MNCFLVFYPFGLSHFCPSLERYKYKRTNLVIIRVKQVLSDTGDKSRRIFEQSDEDDYTLQ